MTVARAGTLVVALWMLGLCQVAGADGPPVPDEQAAWELKVLGAVDEARLRELWEIPKVRRVRLGIVGQGGVSVSVLKRFEEYGHTFTYHDCTDPGNNTHDTAMLKGILCKTTPLGIKVDAHLWHPGAPPAELAADFAEAGETCDVVSLYQSFWGPGYRVITEAIRNSPGALFVSPYVGYQQRPTNTTPQGEACKPWVPESIGHFVTVIPLSRLSGDGRLLTPLDRNMDDSEAVNFVAPSYYASGPGGTCPGAEVGTTCAAATYAVMPEKPTPAQVVNVLRTTSTIDSEALTSVREFDGEAVERLRGCIEAMLHPAEGKQRMIDAAGVLNIYAAMKAGAKPVE